VRGYKTGKNDNYRERPVPILRWFSWDRISAAIRKRKFRAADDIYRYDGSPWLNEFDITYAWVSYKITITAASITAFCVGIGQLFIKLMG